MSGAPIYLRRQLEEDRAAVLARRRALERQLAIAVLASCLYFVLLGAGALVAILLLLDHTRSDDLVRVASLSLAGGALGATVRALWEVMDTLERGRWELADGTLISRPLRRSSQARQEYLREHPAREDQQLERSDQQASPEEDLAPGLPGQRLSKQELAEIEAAEQERVALGLTRAEYELLRKAEEDAAQSWGYSIYDLPLLILLPLLGAALGLVAFAGFVGGFLVASGSSSPSYSPTGLLFIAALAGMFAPNFIAALSRAADAIFGKTSEPPPRA